MKEAAPPGVQSSDVCVSDVGLMQSCDVTEKLGHIDSVRVILCS